jgi:hypothetical protein
MWSLPRAEGAPYVGSSDGCAGATFERAESVRSLDNRLVHDDRRRNETMGLFDKAKNLAGKNKDKIEDGIDKAAEVAEGKLGDKVGADKIEDAAEKAKDGVDKLADD